VVVGLERWVEDCVAGAAMGQRGELGRWEGRESPAAAATGMSETVAVGVVVAEAPVGVR
jgi:hypothetical protein